MYDIEKTFSIFKLPIHYVKEKRETPTNLIVDLELLKTKTDDTKPIYNLICKPTNDLGNKCLKEWSTYYSVNKDFLKDSQKIYKNCRNIKQNDYLVNNTLNIYKKIKNNKDFLDKYQYIDIEKIKWLNNSSLFLCFLSFYNISSPIFNLLAPIFVLLMPFIILKTIGAKITIDLYTKILIKQLKNHIIGKLFFSFNEVSLGQKIYMLFMFGLYIYNIYSNIITCYKFYKNTFEITEDFDNFKKYFEYTINNMDYILDKTKKYKTYSSFSNNLLEYRNRIQHFYNEIKVIPKNAMNIYNIVSIGKIMKYYFTIYNVLEVDDIMHYSFGFNGFLNTIKGLYYNIQNKNVNSVKYLKNSEVHFENIYHPSIENNIVKNNIKLKKNIVITGPNASGKTTILKATTINILFSQQFGFSYLEKGKMGIFDYIHCYINIPDTSARDSLFQAEVKRCKHILDCIIKNKNKKHFCIFDELFSGTNPYEAISSGVSYLDYISKNKNVKFILTTHFMKICMLLKKKNKEIINCNMEMYMNNDIPIYKYKIKHGICKIKGGIQILKDLKYPNEIISHSKKILNAL